MSIYHDSHDIEYRRPFGAAPCGSEVRLFIHADGIRKCDLLLWDGSSQEKRIPMKAVNNGFKVTIKMPKEPKLLWYCFNLDALYYGNTERLGGGLGRVYDRVPPCYQITVYKESKTPDWYKNGIVYQIFPDRFNRGSDWIARQMNAASTRGKNSVKRLLHEQWDDTPFYPKDEQGNITYWPFFGGTLEGIREKLDYLRALGVTVIYLNPIFKAASNHKYDTCDYMTIDEGFGDEASFKTLCESAKKRGIRIILDGVFSHTGADSIYFDKYSNYGGGACEGESSKYYSWYRFQHFPDKYECWWGVLDLPNVEENNPAFRKYICNGENSVIRKWLRAGASGWRLDVADELPDNFIKDIRKAMDETKEDSVLLGEVWEDASNKVSYGDRRQYLLGDELHSTMNYPFRRAVIDYVLGKISSYELGSVFMSLKENYPPENFYGALNLIGSHDRKRTLTLMGEPPRELNDREKAEYRLPPDAYKLAVARMKLISLIQYTSPGVPCLYYGDEAGLEGYEDPFNRGTYPWGNENMELIHHYEELGRLRTGHPALISGDYRPLYFGNKIYGSIRTHDDETLFTLFNRGRHESAAIDLPKGCEQLLYAEGGDPIMKNGTITIPPLCGVVLK